MEYATLTGYVIMLILGIALVMIARRDYADGQCRSKLWAWLIGLFWIVVGGISSAMLIYTIVKAKKQVASE